MGKHNFSDQEIVVALNARMPDAYEELYPKLYSMLFYTSFRITRDRVESEDIVRSVFVDIYTKFRHVQFKSYPQASGYIFKAVRNRSLDYWDRHGRRYVEFDDRLPDEGAADYLSAKYGEVLWNLRFDRIEGILKNSSKRSIKVLKLIFLEQKSAHDIAELMDIEVQTVWNLKTLGLKKVREWLKETQISTGPFLLLLFFWKW